MKIDLKSGKYIVAVSGGVDSVVLLDMLVKQPGVELIVAHFDHGIRGDSSEDRKFVANLSQKYELPFEYAEGNLGASSSEDKARQARYEFLRRICKKYRADAIVTAHHQDDVIETMFINLLRGTKQKGLVSLANTEDIVRPLLNTAKTDIKAYAQKNNLQWREDSTNNDEKYLRNWVRNNVVTKLEHEQRQSLLNINSSTRKNTEELEHLLENMGAEKPKLDRKIILQLSHDSAKEYIAHWLRSQHQNDFDAKTIERIVLGAKTLEKGKKIPIKNGVAIEISSDCLLIVKAQVA